MQDKTNRGDRVRAAVLNWRQPAGEEKGLERHRIRSAVIEAAILLIIGLVLLRFTDKPVIGWIMICAGSVTGVTGLFMPPAYKALKKAGRKLGHAAGVCLTWLLLVPFFYICFPLGRLILAVRRDDPLHRRFPTDEKTYWVTRNPDTDLSRYERQH